MPKLNDLVPRSGRRERIHRQLDEAWRWSTGLPAELDPHDLLGRARQQALLEDFGSGSFRTGFDQLVDALNETANLHTFGRWAWRDRLVSLLINRLAVQDWTKKNPLVHHERVAAPIVITGFDSAGIALLAAALQLDPNVRTPHDWEVAAVCPPQTIGQPLPPAARKSPGPDRPGSCDRLLGTEFIAPFELDADVPSYGDWFVNHDLTVAYELHHHQLKVLQNALPTTQWVLHGMSHAWHLPALFDQYPDARVVWVHRDPVVVLAEAASHRKESQALTSDRPFDAGFVDHWAGRIEAGLASARSPRSSVFDMQAVEVSDDPVGAIEMMYRDFGLVLGDLGRHRMQAAFHAGVLTESVERQEIGRTQVGSLRERFATYVATFEVPTERGLP